MDYWNHSLRVLNFTHKDMDGATCGIVLQHVYDNVLVEPVSTTDLMSIPGKIETMRGLYDIVVFTDLCMPELMDAIHSLDIAFVVIDHHQDMAKYHNPEKNIYVDCSVSAAKLLYTLAKDKVDLTALAGLIDVVNDYDLWRGCVPYSIDMQILYRQYGFTKFLKSFAGGFWGFDDSDIQLIEKYRETADAYLKSLRVFELPCNGAWVEADRYYETICEDFDTKYDWYCIGHVGADRSTKVSIRSRFDKGEPCNVNIGDIVATLGVGGGHPGAAGMRVDAGIEVTPYISMIADGIEASMNGDFEKWATEVRNNNACVWN